jgi:putative ABC transport system substrate-binding protein
MRRREFIALVGATAVWPLAARAQAPPMPVVGVLFSDSPYIRTSRIAAFRKGLGEEGFVEGGNIAVEYRWAEAQNDRLPALAGDLVRQQVSVIASVGGIPSALAAQAATSTIPTVFLVGVDPVEAGLVASLNRPGGNLTGIATLNVELGPKRLELLHELVPKAKDIALLVNPTNPNAEIQTRDLQTAATSLGLKLHVLGASSERAFDAAFARMVEMRVGALVIGTGGPFIGRAEQLAELAIRHALPAIFLYRDFVAAGGLASYGASSDDGHRLVGVYTGRILKGEKPADLPVQQVTKVELIINLKTAKALGLTVPLPLVGRADEVIE